jgi:chromosome segregation ATPase
LDTHGSETRLDAQTQLCEAQAKELAAARARIDELSKVGAELGAWACLASSRVRPYPLSALSQSPTNHPTGKARKAALEAAASAAAASSLTTHAQLLQEAKAEAEQLRGRVLPDLGKRLAACEAREAANAQVLAEGRQAVERAQAMLTEHRSEGARLLAHAKRVEAQLGAATAGKAELETEVAGLKARVASLECAVRQRDASLHELRGQNRELSGQLEKVGFVDVDGQMGGLPPVVVNCLPSLLSYQP